jgi:PST family polysaccharide transporter
MYLVTRPLMIGLILAGLPWGPVGVAVGHSASFALYWVVSLVYLGRVTGLDSRRLLRQALVALGVLTLPLGLLAHLGTRLVDGSVLQLLVGGGLALAWVGLLLLALPSARAELVAARGLLRRRRVTSG